MHGQSSVMNKLELEYKKSGQIQDSVQAIITLVIGVGVGTLVLIFVSVLGGQTYSQTATQLLALNATDTQAYGNVTAAIRSGFSALNTVGGYMPIIVLAVIIFVVLSLVTALNRPAMGMGGYGSVL
jgi:hypothetical protein